MEVEYKELNIRDIQEAEINPQIMGEDDFKRLVKNIKKDGVLTSAPLVMKSGNNYRCISGHHRIRAALKAGIHKTTCAIIEETDISTRLRLQLVHNDIHGEPDQEIVKQLQAKITEEDLSLCDVLIEQARQEETTIDVEVPQFKYVNICLLPESKEAFVQMMDFLNDDSEKYLIEKPEYEHLKDLLTLAFRAGYKTPARAFRKFMDIIDEHRDEIGEAG